MVNEANFSVSGYVATQPSLRFSPTGQPSVSMRVGWTPRRLGKLTNEWEDQPSSFVSVVCFRKVAEHAAKCLHKGEPVVLSGTLQVREYTDARGEKRLSVDVVAQTLGHDMSRGLSHYARVQTSAGMTAEEAWRAQAAAQADGSADGSGADGSGADGSRAADGAAPADRPGRPEGAGQARGARLADGRGPDEDTGRDADDDRDLDDDRDEPFGAMDGLEVPDSPEGLSVPAAATA